MNLQGTVAASLFEELRRIILSWWSFSILSLTLKFKFMDALVST